MMIYYVVEVDAKVVEATGRKACRQVLIVTAYIQVERTADALS